MMAEHKPCLTPRFRSIFMSDLHLGAPGSKASEILDFLLHHDAETLFLVGDIFDLWDPMIIQWGTTEQRIVSLLAERAANGQKIVWLVGNHDRALLTEKGLNRRELSDAPKNILRDVVHISADGQRYLVLHGDVCDARILRFHIWTRIGSRIDSLLRLCDRALRRLRFRLNADARGPVEIAICAMNSLLYRSRAHERRLIALASAAGCDGVICGHFHIAALHDEHGLRYVNCGDWTDSCTAIVEDWNGTLALMRYGIGAPAPVGRLQPEGA